MTASTKSLFRATKAKAHRDDQRDTTSNHPDFRWMDRTDTRQKGLI